MIICTLCPVCVCVSVCRPNEPNRMILLSLSLPFFYFNLFPSLSPSPPLPHPVGRLFVPHSISLSQLITSHSLSFSLSLSLPAIVN